MKMIALLTWLFGPTLAGWLPGILNGYFTDVQNGAESLAEKIANFPHLLQQNFAIKIQYYWN